MKTDLLSIHRRIASCEACPRLRKHCLEVARIKRKSYASETYHGKPIAGFGDPRAELVIVGLAPAAHGANRTGRIFTGDRSGDWLYRALHKADFANQPTSKHASDGLELKNAYITCVVKCAPPDNKPNPAELKRCSSTHLAAELKEFAARKRVYLALGQIALQGLWALLETEKMPRPKFGHGVCTLLPNNQGWLLMSYHPSQQNTFTGRLTEPMFDAIFTQARNLLSSRAPIES